MPLVALLLAPVGCTHDRPLHVAVHDEVRLPERAAVLFLVDGLDRTRMNELLSAGELPNIGERLMARGTVVENACTSVPSITYANLAAILTGQFPGTHGIAGNKWFDRAALRVHDYATTATYRDVDGDFHTPTIYERLSDELTVSIQCAVRRGATRIIDNWATSGINWFFQGFDEVDTLIAMRFELIARLANNVGRWPVFVNAYFPGVDETGHRYGVDSPEYARSLRNLDAQIGRIMDAYERIGLIDDTYFVLTSDHGHVPIEPERRFDVATWLRSRAGLRVCTGKIPDHSYERRYVWMKSYDAVVVNGGGRQAAIHLRGPPGWEERPAVEYVLSVLGHGGGLWNEPCVGLLAMRAGPDRVAILSASGRAAIQRAPNPKTGQPTYTLRVEQGDPLGYLENGSLAPFVRAGPHTSREWLAMTAGTAHPDLVPQVVEMFDSPHSGDAAVFASSGAGFDRAARGGHGSAMRRDVIVPMIWRGPGVAAGGRIDSARTVDVMPTLLELLGRPLSDRDAVSLDGASLADSLRTTGAGSQ